MGAKLFHLNRKTEKEQKQKRVSSHFGWQNAHIVEVVQFVAYFFFIYVSLVEWYVCYHIAFSIELDIWPRVLC